MILLKLRIPQKVQLLKTVSTWSPKTIFEVDDTKGIKLYRRLSEAHVVLKKAAVLQASSEQQEEKSGKGERPNQLRRKWRRRSSGTYAFSHFFI